MSELPPFADHFTQLKKVHQDLVPPLAEAIVRLSAHPVTSETDLECPALSMSQQHRFYKSELYKTWMCQKVAGRIETVQANHDAPNATRSASVRELLKHEVTEEQKTALEFAQTMLSGLEPAEENSYLLEGGSPRFVLLVKWFGLNDPRLYLEGLIKAKFTSPNAGHFMKMVDIASRNVEAIPNVTVKGLLRDYAKLQE